MLYHRGRIALSRPKRQRRRAPDESRDPKNPNRMRKFGAMMQCEKCHGLGHNKRSCTTTKVKHLIAKNQIEKL
jgi:hypothetical protein